MDEVGMLRDVAQEQGRPRLAHVVADPAPAPGIARLAVGHPVTDAPADAPVLGEQMDERAAGAEGPGQFRQRAVEHLVDLERAVKRARRLVQEHQTVGERLGLALAVLRFLEVARVLERETRVVGERGDQLDLARLKSWGVKKYTTRTPCVSSRLMMGTAR